MSRIQPQINKSKSPKPRGTWTTAEDSVDDTSGGQLDILSRIETSLAKVGLFERYLEATEDAGGRNLSTFDRIKIAGYIHFQGEGSPSVHKPLVMLKEQSLTDDIRNIGIRTWGDIRTHPLRVLITKAEETKWIEMLGTPPSETVLSDSSFLGLNLDDRITWAHRFLSRYHSLMSSIGTSKDETEAVIKAMKLSCKDLGIKEFVEEWAKVAMIRFSVDIYQGRMRFPEVLASADDLERSRKPASVVDDAEVYDVKTSAVILKKIIPTLKAMGQYEEYRRHLARVRKYVYNGGKTEIYDRLAVARYLIMQDVGTISYFPNCLKVAEDKEVKARLPYTHSRH